MAARKRENFGRVLFAVLHATEREAKAGKYWDLEVVQISRGRDDPIKQPAALESRIEKFFNSYLDFLPVHYALSPTDWGVLKEVSEKKGASWRTAIFETGSDKGRSYEICRAAIVFLDIELIRSLEESLRPPQKKSDIETLHIAGITKRIRVGGSSQFPQRLKFRPLDEERLVNMTPSTDEVLAIIESQESESSGYRNVWHINLSKLDLRKVDFQDPRFHRLISRSSRDVGFKRNGTGLFELADFSDCDLRGANLQGLAFDGANFENANLAKANLKSTTFCIVVISGQFSNADGDLYPAFYERAVLRAANLSQANLAGAEIRGADLRRADFSHAKFQGASLGYNDCGRANFSHANLRNAALEDKALFRANLAGAIMPDGKVHR